MVEKYISQSFNLSMSKQSYDNDDTAQYWICWVWKPTTISSRNFNFEFTISEKSGATIAKLYLRSLKNILKSISNSIFHRLDSTDKFITLLAKKLFTVKTIQIQIFLNYCHLKIYILLTTINGNFPILRMYLR